MTDDGLAEEREFLLQTIRDLDEEYAAGELDEADYRTLRDDYTARAAEVLRRIEATSADSAPSPSPSPEASADTAAAAAAGVAAGSRRTAPRRGRPTKAIAAAVVLAVISAGAGYAVATSSGERLATDEASGEIVQGSTDRITKAQMLARDGRILDSIKVYDELLEDDPDNPVALAQKGWLLSRVGEPSLVDKGLASIDRAIAAEPSYADAYFFRGMILWRAKGQPAEAVETFQRGIETNPPPDLLASLQEVKQLAEADAATTTTAPSATP